VHLGNVSPKTGRNLPPNNFGGKWFRGIISKPPQPITIKQKFGCPWKKIGGSKNSKIGAKFSTLGRITLEPVGIRSPNLSTWCGHVCEVNATFTLSYHHSNTWKYILEYEITQKNLLNRPAIYYQKSSYKRISTASVQSLWSYDLMALYKSIIIIIINIIIIIIIIITSKGQKGQTKHDSSFNIWKYPKSQRLTRLQSLASPFCIQFVEAPIF